MKNFFYLIILTSLLACQNKQKQSNEKFKNELEQVLSQSEHYDSFNGIIGILQKDKAPLLITHGYKSPLAKKHALGLDDYFHLASCSKLFTGLTVLQLIEEYSLNPDDSIQSYFPELHPNLGAVTISQLANHTCAIHDYLSLVDEPINISNDQAISLLSKLDSTVYTPGTRWGYTNSGYVLLSLLIERASNSNYNDYLKQKTLLPLGLQNAQLHPSAISSLKGFKNGNEANTASITTGDAGIYIRAEDLVPFFNNQSKFKNYWSEAKSLSSPWVDSTWRYGYGWFFSSDAIGDFRAHAGKSGGFESYIRVYDTNELMIFILSNHINNTAKPTREEVLKWLIEKKLAKEPII